MGIANKEMYFDILSDVLESDCEKYLHLFEEIEVKLLKTMISLTRNDETKDAIKLLSRLMLRKAKWFRTDDFSYHEIKNITDAISVLVEHEIFIKSDRCGVDENLLQCVGKNK